MVSKNLLPKPENDLERNLSNSMSMFYFKLRIFYNSLCRVDFVTIRDMFILLLSPLQVCFLSFLFFSTRALNGEKDIRQTNNLNDRKLSRSRPLVYKIQTVVEFLFFSAACWIELNKSGISAKRYYTFTHLTSKKKLITLVCGCNYGKSIYLMRWFFSTRIFKIICEMSLNYFDYYVA
uniref:Uncharacterized protein n=1 Tax=Glossina pallidipes TaxID=7398 RepID=A0A1A9ZF41_GLOPL